MATLKNTDILNGYTKEGVAQKYFIYERDKTHEPIEVALNNDIEKQIDYLKENFFCTEDYLLPIITTDESGKALYEHIINNLEDLSTYFARHSFVMALFNKTKSIDIVSAGFASYKHRNNQNIS